MPITSVSSFGNIAAMNLNCPSKEEGKKACLFPLNGASAWPSSSIFFKTSVTKLPNEIPYSKWQEERF